MKRKYDRHIEIDRQELLEYFTYTDGLLYNKKGVRAGGLDKTSGYRKVSFKNKRYMEHIIIWLMFYDEIPSGYVIDHINYISDDNRIENLRLASRSQSNQHRRGYKNYYLNKDNKYFVRVYLNRTPHVRGDFLTEKEAIEAARQLRMELFGDFRGDFNG